MQVVTKLISVATVAAGLLVAAPGYAGIGVTDCASADGKLLRVEQEVWGANPVTWTYDGETVANDRIKVDQDATVLVTDSIRQHPELGDERTLVTVEQVTLSLSGGAVVQERALCRSVEYPGVLD